MHVTCICPSHVNTQLFGGFCDGSGGKALLLEAKDVAYATVEAVELAQELVILPRVFWVVPALKGVYESVTGKLGFGWMARFFFSDRNLHSRMPLDPTHVRLKRTCV